MSRTPSSISASGMQVATQPTSGVYTVLMAIATVFLAAGIVVAILSSQSVFGYAFPLGSEYEAAKNQSKAFIDQVNRNDNTRKKELDKLKTGNLTDAEAGATGGIGSQPIAPPPVTPPPVEPEVTADTAAPAPTSVAPAESTAAPASAAP